MSQGPVMEWIVGASGALLTLFAIPTKVVKDNHKRSTKNKRQLQGDDDDPNDEGVLQISKRNGEKIDKLEERMQEQHAEVLETVEDLAEERRGHD